MQKYPVSPLVVFLELNMRGGKPAELTDQLEEFKEYLRAKLAKAYAWEHDVRWRKRFK